MWRIICAGVCLGVICWLWEDRKLLKCERDVYRSNTEALLDKVERYQTDSACWVADSRVLRLSIAEYKQYRAKDMETIERLGIENGQLRAAARQDLSVNVSVKAPVRDSVVIRDSIPVVVERIRYVDRYVSMDACVEDSLFVGNIRLNARLNQAVYRVYKHRFLWWRWGTKAVRQVVTCDNPYVEIDYSEFIDISN